MANLLIGKILTIIKLPLRNRYRVYTSTIFFLLIAFIYLNTVRTRYKVSSKIIVNTYPGLSLETVSTDLKSKPLVQNAIDQLALDVNYYRESAPKKEIYGDLLPIKLVWNSKSNYTNALLFSPLSSHSFSIEHEDTIQFFEINEAVNRYYGKFKVVRGPAFSSHFPPVFVKINQPVNLFKAYYNDLKINADEKSNTIALSVLINNAQKGRDFLNKLLELYTSEKAGSKSKITQDYNNLQKLGNQVAALKMAVKSSEKKSATAKYPALSMQQLKTLEVIAPYLQKPVEQFVQVPYTDEVQNTVLRSDLERLNKTELDKQRLLGGQKIDDLAVRNIDYQLNGLKVNILNSIDLLKNGKSGNVTIAKTDIEKRLHDAELKYKNLSATITASSSTGIIRIVEKPGDNIEEVTVNTFWVYALALFAGILLPLIFTFFKSVNTSARTTWFNSQTLIEKIKILLGVRQID